MSPYRTRSVLFVFLILSIVIWLSACGGGGGNDASHHPSSCGTPKCIQAVLDGQEPPAVNPAP